MPITFRGQAAQIRWGYHCAATLGTWTVEAGVLSAQIEHVDAFRVSQSPLMLVVGASSHPLDGLQISGGTLTARLGPQENSDAASSSTA